MNEVLDGYIREHIGSYDYTNRTGQQIKKNYEGFLARIIQHEFDHLNGITFVERMEKGEELVTEGEFIKQINLAEGSGDKV